LGKQEAQFENSVAVQPWLGLERIYDRDDATVEGLPAGSGRGTQQGRRDPVTLRRVEGRPEDGRQLRA
jgi:hypothetical protein